MPFLTPPRLVVTAPPIPSSSCLSSTSSKGVINQPITIDSDGSNNAGSARITQRWPAGITMSELAKFALECNPVTHPIYETWAKYFDGRYIYRQSTVTKYRRWVLAIGKQQLSQYLEHSGNTTVPQGVIFFCKIWDALDKHMDNSTAPRKRVRRA